MVVPQSSTLLGKNKIVVLQSQLETSYDRYVDARRLYEAEARKTYVLQEANNKLEDEIATLKNNAKPLKEVKDQAMQTDPLVIEIQDEGVSTEQMDIEVLEEKKETEISTMKGLLIYRIDILKRISHNVRNTFLSLQGIEFQCTEVLQVLTLLFNQWGPYSLFFDKITQLLTKKKDLPKVTIV